MAASQELTQLLGRVLSPIETETLLRHIKQKTPVICGEDAWQFSTPTGRYSIEVLATTLHPCHLPNVDINHPWCQLFAKLSKASGMIETPTERHNANPPHLFVPLCRYTQMVAGLTERRLRRAILDLQSVFSA